MQIKLDEKKIGDLILLIQKEDDELSLKLKKNFEDIQQEVIFLNKNLKIDLNSFRKNKRECMKKLLTNKESFLKENYSTLPSQASIPPNMLMTLKP